jgi:hypothetical protein
MIFNSLFHSRAFCFDHHVDRLSSVNRFFPHTCHLKALDEVRVCQTAIGAVQGQLVEYSQMAVCMGC